MENPPNWAKQEKNVLCEFNHALRQANSPRRLMFVFIFTIIVISVIGVGAASALCRWLSSLLGIIRSPLLSLSPSATAAASRVAVHNLLLERVVIFVMVAAAVVAAAVGPQRRVVERQECKTRRDDGFHLHPFQP